MDGAQWMTSGLVACLYPWLCLYLSLIAIPSMLTFMSNAYLGPENGCKLLNQDMIKDACKRPSY